MAGSAELSELLTRLEEAIGQKLEPNVEVLRQFAQVNNVIALDSGELLRSLLKFQEDNQVVIDDWLVTNNETIESLINGARAADVALGIWASGKVFNNYNEYMTFNGVPYKVKANVQLPYQATGSDPTASPDSDFVSPYKDISIYNVGLYTTRDVSTATELATLQLPAGTRVNLLERKGRFIISNGVANGYDVLETGTAGLVAVLETPSVTNEISVSWFGCFGEQGVDYHEHIKRALATGYNICFHEGEFGVSNTNFPEINQHIRGMGIGKTKLKALGDLPLSCFRSNGNDGINIRDMTLDGNKANRPLATGGCGIMNNASHGVFKYVESYNWPNAGLLFDGQLYTCSNNKVKYCRVTNNNGVGVSQYASRFMTFFGNELSNNGKENLTIDNGSFGGVYMGNRFGKHQGGCGCVGWDQSDNVRFTSNILDGENAELATVGNRVGICWNAVAGPNLRSTVSGNTIINYPEAKIYLKNRTNDGQYEPGGGEVFGNTFDGLGDTDIIIEDTSHPLFINQPQARFTMSGISKNVKLHSNAISLDTQVLTDQPLPFDGSWHTVNFTQPLELKNISQGTEFGSWNVRLGGKFQLYVKLRLTDVEATGSAVSIAVNTNGTRTELFNQQIDGMNTVYELTLSPNITIDPGPIKVEARLLGATVDANIKSGGDSAFQLTYIG